MINKIDRSKPLGATKTAQSMFTLSCQSLANSTMDIQTASQWKSDKNAAIAGIPIFSLFFSIFGKVSLGMAAKHRETQHKGDFSVDRMNEICSNEKAA